MGGSGRPLSGRKPTLRGLPGGMLFICAGLWMQLGADSRRVFTARQAHLYPHPLASSKHARAPNRRRASVPRRGSTAVQMRTAVCRSGNPPLRPAELDADASSWGQTPPQPVSTWCLSLLWAAAVPAKMQEIAGRCMVAMQTTGNVQATERNSHICLLSTVSAHLKRSFYLHPCVMEEMVSHYCTRYRGMIRTR